MKSIVYLCLCHLGGGGWGGGGEFAYERGGDARPKF